MVKRKHRQLIKKIKETSTGFHGYEHRSHRTNNHSIDFKSIGLKKKKLSDIKEREAKRALKSVLK